MQHLRLVGVQEDGEHLLLGSDDGASFVLRIDEALRAATARPIGRPSAPAADRADTALSPREIQARIRTGSTAEEVAAASGLPLAHVQRYEGPVRAERDYIAQQARNVEVSGPQGNEGYRSAFGDEAATLGEMVVFRLGNFGVDASSLEWDAWRRSDGAWDVVARFELVGADARTNIGEEPPARWVFHPARKSLQNSNRWAQVLSELEALDSPFTARRLTTVADRPFDFESDAPNSSEVVDEAAPADNARSEAEELLEVLRSRRGQRLGADEDGDDALALMLSKGSIPAAHPRDEEFVDDDEARRLGFAASHEGENENGDADSLPRLHDGVGTDTPDITVTPGLRAVHYTEEPKPAAEPAEPAAGHGEERQGKKAKQKRSSVPSWDEIVFGKKHND